MSGRVSPDQRMNQLQRRVVDHAVKEALKIRLGIPSQTRCWTSEYQEVFPQLVGVDWQREAWKLWWVP